MNERIKELRKQVSMDLTKYKNDPEFYKTHVEPLANLFTDGNNAMLNEYMTKFAESIVKECLGLCDRWPDTVRQVMTRQIKEHFGVE